MSATDPDVPTAGERADLLESLGTQRFLFLRTVEGLTDEQAASTPTVSSLSLGGLVKHLTLVEDQWVRFVTDGPVAMDLDPQEWDAAFRMDAGEHLEELLEGYRDAAARTDALVRDLPDLDARQPLPEAPWFPPGATRSARRVVVHLTAEIAQHSGHADFIRESIDGQKTMG